MDEQNIHLHFNKNVRISWLTKGLSLTFVDVGLSKPQYPKDFVKVQYFSD